MSNIRKAFENGKALMVFITCGDPDLETTAQAVRSAVENGASLIALGIPFSDPTAEGPLFLEASLRALRGGVTANRIFAFVERLRQEVRVPMVFMTYANVVCSYGAKRFISDCRDVGMDGLILSDLPFEEKEELWPLCRQYGIDLVSLIAPAPENRIAMIAKEAEGFLMVSSPKATGIGNGSRDDLASVIHVVRQNTDIPCIVGDGISTPKQVQEMADISDGVLVGEAIVKLLGTHGKEAPGHIGKYVKSMIKQLGPQ